MTLSELPHWLDMALWGAIATAALTGVMQSARGLGLSRLSIPFMVGTMFSGDRGRATIIGVAVYVAGGWVFAFLYILVLTSLDLMTWWAGGVLGFMHGLILLVGIFPYFPLIHPRMASDYDAPVARPLLEPPGFLALNYGRGTPTSMLLAQILYGVLIGGLPQLQATLA